MKKSKYSDSQIISILRQAEAGTPRHSFPIDAESRSLTSETNAQVLEKNYHKVLGTSGSVRGSQAEQDELFSRYPADVFDLPTHNPSQKKIHTPKYFAQQKLILPRKSGQVTKLQILPQKPLG